MEWYDDGRYHYLSLPGCFRKAIYVFETGWYENGEITPFVEIHSDFLSLPNYPDGLLKLSPRKNIMFEDVASAKVWCEKFLIGQVQYWVKKLEVPIEKTPEE